MDALGQRLRLMNDSMIHRGPDEDGIHIDPAMRSGIAIRRLSIMDPEHGSQPLFNEEKTVAVVCNGEIYNHRELRRELVKKGHRFRGHSDCEVLAHLYEEEGIDFLKRLNGMFALALLDTRCRSLLLARDPVGMKHLYWSDTKHGLAFSSEARSLFAAGLVRPQPDWDSLGDFFSMGFLPSPGTAFQGVRRLRPGSYVVLGEKGMEEGRFWVPRFQEPEPGRTEQDYAEELTGLLNSAVGTHLDADFPAGLFLSGGWDSSLLTLYASRLSKQRLKSFSLVFPDDPGPDESKFSRQVSQQAGTQGHEIEIRDTDIQGALGQASLSVEEPNVCCPNILTYLLSKSAGQVSKLVLGGEGADELFAGYDWFRPNRHHDMLRKLPHQLFPASLPIPLGSRLDRALRFVAAPDEERAQLALRTAPPEGVIKHFRPGISVGRHVGQRAQGLTDETRMTFRDELDLKLSLEMTGRMADGILFSHDKTSMAHSLEIRMPFLDLNVVEFAHRLPSRFKIRNGQMKAVLSGLAGELPADVSKRKKQGLNVPYRMYQSPVILNYLTDTILETSLATGLFDHRRLEPWVRKLSTDSGRSIVKLWAIGHFCLWWNNFIEREDWT